MSERLFRYLYDRRGRTDFVGTVEYYAYRRLPLYRNWYIRLRDNELERIRQAGL